MTSWLREVTKIWCVGSTEDIDRGERRMQLVFKCSTEHDSAGLVVGKGETGQALWEDFLVVWQAWPRV